MYSELVHTPLVPFAVNMLGATAGVMITASHNPAQDNGYKVYWSNGCQIIPPHDKLIALHIEQNLKPLNWDVSHVLGSDRALLGEVKDAYFKSLGEVAKVRTCDGEKDFGFVYTAMHGVGLAAMRRVVADMGLTDNMVVVSEQVRNYHKCYGCMHLYLKFCVGATRSRIPYSSFSEPRGKGCPRPSNCHRK